jgi:hypothetical protein
VSIIDFQKAKEKREQAKADNRIKEAVTHEELVSDLSAHAIFDLIDILDHLGYPIEDNQDCITDILLLDESIKSLMYRIKKMPYAVHAVSDAMFEVKNKEEALSMIRNMVTERDEYDD